MWVLEELQGKYYGTSILNYATGDIIKVWLSMGKDDKASEREIKYGWTENRGYDHVELQSSYEAAKKIVDALNA